MSSSTKASPLFSETIKNEDFLLAVCDAVLSWKAKYPYDENTLEKYDEIDEKHDEVNEADKKAEKDVVGSEKSDELDDQSNKIVKEDKKVEDENDELTDEQSSDWLTTGSEFIGRHVRRKFGKKVIVGIIIGWLPPDGEDIALWHVEHIDGDEEDLEEFEVKKYLLPTDDPEAIAASEKRALKLEKEKRRKLMNLKFSQRMQQELQAKSVEKKKVEMKSIVVPPIIQIKEEDQEIERKLRVMSGRSTKKATINWKQVEKEFKLNYIEYQDNKKITPFFLRAIWKFMAYGDVVDKCYSYNMAYDSDLDDMYLQPLEAAERYLMDANTKSSTSDSTRVLCKRPRIEAFANIGRSVAYEPRIKDKSLEDPRVVTNAKAFVRLEEHTKQWTLSNIMCLPLSHKIDNYSSLKRLRAKIDSEAVFTFNTIPPILQDKGAEKKAYDKKKYMKKERREEPKDEPKDEMKKKEEPKE